MNKNNQKPDVAEKKCKISLYLNAERLDVLNKTMEMNEGPMSLQEAIYQILDWWAIDVGVKPPSVEHEDVAHIKQLLHDCVIFQEELILKVCDSVSMLQRTFEAAIDSGPAQQVQTSMPNLVAGPPARPAHKTLGTWLLDTLTRVGHPKTTKIVAVLRKLHGPEIQQSQFLGVQLLSIEGSPLTNRHESAIDREAFGVPLVLDVPTYAIFNKLDQGSWEVQLRTKADSIQESKVIWNQKIEY